MKTHAITLQDVHAAMEYAKDVIVKLPTGVTIPGSRRSLTEGERLGYAYLTGSLSVLGRLGVDTGGITVEYQNRDVK